MVKCGVRECPLISEDGFCKKKIVFLNGGAMCDQVYDKMGRMRTNWFKEAQQEANVRK